MIVLKHNLWMTNLDEKGVTRNDTGIAVMQAQHCKYLVVFKEFIASTLYG